ncbi:sulfur carrier protein ThiS [Acidovorax sp. Leaf160]|uniref:sulfur carrier protein ThiS n=1 Tax=Acidovorax sp. Leaf160 TaxID=1736280 RepID=UPI0006FD98BD|nr:sulfur carrier protein ThiS [Acidovorax sp. Leaf160]KQR55666.1 thiamine biosynthesis protein ThiS [Acidovorax sp. Leaf160]
MNILINQAAAELPPAATVSDAIAHAGARPPFAVAVNLQFVPKGRYEQHALAEGDRVEIIAPVTGG